MSHTGTADGGQQAAEVGVRGEEGGFDQRGAGDGIGGPACFVAAFGVADFDGDEFGRAFAIADDGLGEFEGEAAKQVFELFVARVGDVVDFALAVFAGGDDDEAVVGAGVAVHGDAVEGVVGDFLRHQLEDGLGNFGIGGDEAEHGRHVGMNHAGAFGDAGGADGVFFADFAFARGGFGDGVGGHDGARGIRPAGRAHFGQGSNNFVGGQGFEDDAGGEGEDLGRGAACLFGRRFADGHGAVKAFFARSRVGVAGVDDEGSYAVCIEQVLFADAHGCGAEAVLGKHRADCAAVGEQHQCEVVVLRFFDARLSDEEADAVYGLELAGGGFSIIDCHDFFLCIVGMGVGGRETASAACPILPLRRAGFQPCSERERGRLKKHPRGGMLFRRPLLIEGGQCMMGGKTRNWRLRALPGLLG